MDHLEVVKTMPVRRLVMFAFLGLGAAFANAVPSGTESGTWRMKSRTSLLKMAVLVST